MHYTTTTTYPIIIIRHRHIKQTNISKYSAHTDYKLIPMPPYMHMYHNNMKEKQTQILT